MIANSNVYLRSRPLLRPNVMPTYNAVNQDAAASAIASHGPDVIRRATTNVARTGKTPTRIAAAKVSPLCGPWALSTNATMVTAAIQTADAIQYVRGAATRRCAAEAATKQPKRTMQPITRDSLIES